MSLGKTVASGGAVRWEAQLQPADAVQPDQLPVAGRQVRFQAVEAAQPLQSGQLERRLLRVVAAAADAQRAQLVERSAGQLGGHLGRLF